jgi:predicted RNase H-like nuclease (RuvC/YqgF family)
MELSVQLSCPCKPGFVYKNSLSLAHHKKTKVHKVWEQSVEHKHDKARSKEFENEISRLGVRITQMEEVERELLQRIRQLERELSYWRTACDGVYI